MKDTISVVIRTMPGREQFLDKCLFLLAGQTYQHIEVIVVVQTTSLMSSAEAMATTAKRWEARFDSMELVSHASDQDARARSLNLGKKMARGRYLAFLDDDDKVYPPHYKKLIESLRNSDYAWAYADTIRAEYNEYGQLTSRTSPYKRQAYSFLDHLRGNFIPIHSFVIDRERTPDLGDVDERLTRTEDYEFLLRLAFQHEPLYVPGFGVEYCIRSDGSNTTLDGTVQARVSLRKKREWDTAQMLVDELKVETFGWWVRELNHLPALYPVTATPAPVVPITPRAELLKTASRQSLSGSTENADYRQKLQKYYNSTSWRIAKKIRSPIRRLKGLPPIVDVVPDSEADALAMLHQLLNSRSWECTAPIRLIRRILPIHKTGTKNVD